MIRWRKGEVVRVRREWPGAVELDVTTEEGGVRALAYPALVGRPEPGDVVLLNTTALAMGLGTGGYAMVVAVPDRLPEDPHGPGHLVKARYTPLQATVLGADEQDSPFHEVLREADSLDGMPVVVADLHSALPAILCGLYGAHPPAGGAPGTGAGDPERLTAGGPGSGAAGDAASRAAATGAAGHGGHGGHGGPSVGGGRRVPRVAYVMLDGGALPAWFSMSCARLREAGWLCGVVTVGQAFGGDVETVTTHTGLLAARHVLAADVAIVTQGPGNLGSGTRWGFSGVSAGEAVNAAAVLGGRPVAALRVSEGDLRERHVGVSHHSLTAYGRVALAPAAVAVPELTGDFGRRVAEQARPLGERHELVRVPVDGLYEALRECPVRLSTMGRGLDEDLVYFLASAAAGRHAASLLPGPPAAP
ncbi:hypothetical protein FHS43_005042 [Streptosporangium becharense]|uniref:DUF3866 domain-containing protein n=1 Tax=Streptosporangium becharense TaxID=1816182 RepID=A0A7W9MEY1_9ACTN|nr:DUF3866 family protein [Streptosporangium becharense]MBB2913733.1 hypothetical protein [Streptosporangium becharense]MBB5817814.1 hypothetical protein [Streptosporangium becharense]